MYALEKILTFLKQHYYQKVQGRRELDKDFMPEQKSTQCFLHGESPSVIFFLMSVQTVISYIINVCSGVSTFKKNVHKLLKVSIIKSLNA